MAEREYNFGPGNPDPGVFPPGTWARRAARAEPTPAPSWRTIPTPACPNCAVAAERFERNQGIRPALEDIVITNGAMQSLVLSAQGLVARARRPVVMEEFEYGGTIRVFKQHGLKLVGGCARRRGHAHDAWKMCSRVSHQAGLHFTPTSSYQNSDRDDAAARTARTIARAGATLRPPIEDDTYGDISYEPQSEKAIYAYAKPGEVMYIGSFSKILGPGIRLGFFVAPQPLHGRLMAWKIDGGTSALSQMIAAEYFKDHLWEHVEEGRNSVKDKRNLLLDALETGSLTSRACTGPGLTVGSSCGSSCPRAWIALGSRSWLPNEASCTRPGRRSILGTRTCPTCGWRSGGSSARTSRRGCASWRSACARRCLRGSKRAGRSAVTASPRPKKPTWLLDRPLYEYRGQVAFVFGAAGVARRVETLDGALDARLRTRRGERLLRWARTGVDAALVTPTRHDPSSIFCAPAPTIAQSDKRRRNFTYECGPLATGNDTSVTSSSAASGVENSPRKNSRAGIDRLLVVIVASSISASVP
jgi:aspartate/methionine/tyrosine aminotransferase